MCHRPGEAGPFPLLSYRDVKSHAKQIVDVTRSRFMPPWLPAPGDFKFADERRLGPEQVAIVERWVEQGGAPQEIIATHYVNNNPTSGVQFQRPLCPFPQVARFTGVDTTKASSFECVEDERDNDPRDASLARNSGSNRVEDK